MADVKISALPTVATPTTADSLEVVSGGVSSKISLGALGSFVSAQSVASRIPNMMTGIGDSRVDAFYLNTDQLGYNARSPVMVAKASLGQRFMIGSSFGKSGDRTDQSLARMNGVLPPANPSLPSGDPRTTLAKVCYVQCGVNNIAQVSATGPATYVHAMTVGTANPETVTIATVATVTMRDLREICGKLLAAGMIVVLENEVGANGLGTQEKVTALMNLRQMIREYGEATPGVYVHDALPIITNPTFSATGIQLKPTYAYDATHPNALGSYMWGKSLAALLSAIIPASTRGPLLIENIAEAQTANRRQLLLNPLFATATGGTAGTGTTGTVPASWGVSCVGSATATAGTVANANGIGNDVTIAATFNANGDAARVNQSLSGNGASQYNAQLQVGDMVQAVAQVDITGTPSGLSALYLSLVCNKGGGDPTPTSSFDMFGANAAVDYGINEACTLTLATRPFALPAPTGTFPFLTAEVRAVARAAGSVNFAVRQFGILRRDTVY